MEREVFISRVAKIGMVFLATSKNKSHELVSEQDLGMYRWNLQEPNTTYNYYRLIKTIMQGAWVFVYTCLRCLLDFFVST